VEFGKSTRAGKRKRPRPEKSVDRLLLSMAVWRHLQVAECA